jgi:hypothetical protein
MLFSGLLKLSWSLPDQQRRVKQRDKLERKLSERKKSIDEEIKERKERKEVL